MEKIAEIARYVVLISIAGLIGWFLFGSPDVDFRSSDAKWADSEYEFKGRTLELIVANFELYKLACNAPAARLLRTTRQNWVNVFAWPSYMSNRKWRVPYASPVPAIGDYYPPANSSNCYNEASTQQELDEAEASAKAYLSHL